MKITVIINHSMFSRILIVCKHVLIKFSNRTQARTALTRSRTTTTCTGNTWKCWK